MDQGHFFVFDIMMRACILLGLVFMTFSHFVLIMKNRKANEQMEVLHFCKGFVVQKLPIYSTYACAVLLALSMFRVGSILKVDAARVPSLSIFGITFMSGEELSQKMTALYIICIVGVVLYLASTIFYNTAQVQLGKNYSMDVDIKYGYRLKVNELYGFVRHPLYLGEILLWLCASLTLLSWSLFLWTVCIHIPLYVHRAKAEDELLEFYWKDEYRDYKEHTGAFFPLFFDNKLKRK